MSSMVDPSSYLQIYGYKEVFISTDNEFTFGRFDFDKNLTITGKSITLGSDLKARVAESYLTIDCERFSLL